MCIIDVVECTNTNNLRKQECKKDAGMMQTRESSTWWYYPIVLWLNPHPDPVQPQSDVMDTFNEVTDMARYIFSSDSDGN